MEINTFERLLTEYSNTIDIKISKKEIDLLKKLMRLSYQVQMNNKNKMMT